MKQALLKRLFFKLRWRINNKHNTTKAKNLFHQSSVTVGKHTYGPIEVLYDNGRGRLTIGNYCSIAREVKFFLGGEHNSIVSALGLSSQKYIPAIGVSNVMRTLTSLLKTMCG
ncbi:MAG: hypothetical protein J5711_03780 [Bacteroidales bacterium]|nr:hypothetical protein [Bacteroidales bacterium]